jgi:hypothetical protein
MRSRTSHSLFPYTATIVFAQTLFFRHYTPEPALRNVESLPQKPNKKTFRRQLSGFIRNRFTRLWGMLLLSAGSDAQITRIYYIQNRKKRKGATANLILNSEPFPKSVILETALVVFTRQAAKLRFHTRLLQKLKFSNRLVC